MSLDHERVDISGYSRGVGTQLDGADGSRDVQRDAIMWNR